MTSDSHLSTTMSPPPLSVISSATATATALFPPKPPPLPPPPSSPPPQQVNLISRRNAAVLLSLIAPLIPSLHQPPPASAFSFGISGPKDWLREQKKKSAKYLLAPIDASRNSLRSAYQLLTKSEVEYKEKDIEEVKMLVNSASRDCVVEELNSFVAFQAKTGVEVCTFRLIVNNAASLLDDRDPIKLEAEARLSGLIRSFASLNGMANETDIQVASNRQKVADTLMDTLSSLNNFEQGIKDCLEI